MGDKENRAYKKLSANGRTEYGRDRAKEAEATGGRFDVTMAKLFDGFYSSM